MDEAIIALPSTWIHLSGLSSKAPALVWVMAASFEVACLGYHL